MKKLLITKVKDDFNYLRLHSIKMQIIYAHTHNLFGSLSILESFMFLLMSVYFKFTKDNNMTSICS